MPKWIFTCWSCANTTEMQDKVGRKEECPHCTSDMHACKNCQYYDPGAHNQCRETISEYVPDKERANFCGMFRPRPEGEPEPKVDLDAAKRKLEALFRKS